MANVISVDAGSLSLRSILFDEEGKRLFAAQKQYAPFSTSEGCNEQKPQVFNEALVYTLKEIAGFAEVHSIGIDAISVTSQRSSVFAIGKNGEILCNAMTWHDKRSLFICDRMREDEWEIFKKTGLRLDPMFSAPKMAWLREKQPDIYTKAHKLMGVHEYMLYCLCGGFITDHTIASRTMLQNLFTLEWDEELVGRFGLDKSKLCLVRKQGSICGTLTSKAAKECGLQEGIPIVTAGGDQQCGALGLGILHPGQLEVMSGTGAYVVGVSMQPAIDPDMRFLCNVAAIPGLYVIEAPVLTAGNVYKWFAEFCFPGQNDKNEKIMELNKLAYQTPPGSNGLMFFPYFKGRGAPGWDAKCKGAASGLTLETTRGDFARAILESLVFEIAENVSILQKNCEGSGQKLLVSGGLTKIDLYNQMIADIVQHEVEVGEDSEATALGAWISACTALGVYKDMDQGVKHVLSHKENVCYKPDAANAAVYEQLKIERNVLFHKLY